VHAAGAGWQAHVAVRLCNVQGARYAAPGGLPRSHCRRNHAVRPGWVNRHSMTSQRAGPALPQRPVRRFGLAVLSRLSWVIDPIPTERMRAWASALMWGLFSAGFLVGHWLAAEFLARGLILLRHLLVG